MSDGDKDKKSAPNTERREALIKIGKYAAYTAPAMMVTVGSARAGLPSPPDMTAGPPAPISTELE